MGQQDCISEKNHSIFQKQLFKGVLSKICSENMQQIYRKTWVFSYKYTANFQNTLSEEHLWTLTDLTQMILRRLLTFLLGSETVILIVLLF